MASSFPSLSLTDCFADLPDPRVARTQRHALLDILVIALCALTCGADDFVAIARFGQAKEARLKERLAQRKTRAGTAQRHPQP